MYISTKRSSTRFRIVNRFFLYGEMKFMSVIILLFVYSFEILLIL